MATFTKIYAFTADIGTEKHNLATDQLKVALTNTDPTVSATNYASLTSPLATTNLSGATPFNITTTSYTQTAGVASLVLEDLVLTALGGDVGPCQYVVIYNDTAPSDELI
jgi:hypothetical protein